MVRFEEAFSVFSKIIQEIIQQKQTGTYKHGIQMAEYAQEEWYSFAKDYSVKLFTEKNHLYVTLMYLSEPICYSNGLDGSAYVLSVAFMNHLGMFNKEAS